MTPNLYVQPVILCGGSGTRLWPLSRSGFPKQFICLTGDDSLFQLAVKRLNGLASDSMKLAPSYVVSNESHRFIAQEQLREIGLDNEASFLLEPVGRNTAPALTLAALAARESGKDPILVVTPADQTVADEAAFLKAMQEAISAAANGGVVILGIKPDKPEVGYGYIKCRPGGAVALVECFTEKPDLETAKGFLADGSYYWNAGMFVLKASVWLAALENFRPDIFAATAKAWASKSVDGAFVRPSDVFFTEIPAESIDYAVIEKCPGSAVEVLMVPLAAGWSDLGAWDAVWNVLPKDSSGNASAGDVLLSESRNTLVHASHRLVAAVGVDNLVVVETPDAVLVTDQSRSQEVRNIVTLLNAQKREEHALHRKVLRPWGWYDSIDQGERFKVKRIMVKPGASLSLQKHHHRAEHWIVVRGTAEITRGSEVFLLTENQSVYIPLGETHRLANPGSIALEIIEVQTGSYLQEDDIVRFGDCYGREDK